MKFKLVENINESLFFNEKDIFYNKEEFDSGKINLCFVTGLSGSGKTTMTNEYETLSNVEVVHMDDLQTIKDNFTMDNLKEYGDLIYSFFVNYPQQYVSWDELKDSNVPQSQYEDILFIDFVNYAKQYANENRNKRFILEGIWFFGNKSTGNPMFNPSDFDNYAFYIKGTSELISFIRAAKRDSSDTTNTTERIKSFAKLTTNPKRFGWYKADEKQLERFRKYFRGKI